MLPLRLPLLQLLPLLVAASLRSHDKRGLQDFHLDDFQFNYLGANLAEVAQESCPEELQAAVGCVISDCPQFMDVCPDFATVVPEENMGPVDASVATARQGVNVPTCDEMGNFAFNLFGLEQEEFEDCCMSDCNDQIQYLFFCVVGSISGVDQSHCAPTAFGPPGKENFLSYEPVTTVTDHAVIDLDQKILEEQLAFGTDQGRENALKIYTEGAFSKSYAEVVLDSVLQVDLAKGVTVVGQSADGTTVMGKTAAAFKTGDNIIQVQYHAGTQQATWTNCHVGGNPNPNTEGCFEGTGTLEIGELGTYTYTYNPTQSNYNARTLQGFSLAAEEKMYNCGPGCPYETYNKFYQYYGVYDYANQWVLAAFNRGGTNFAKGNAQFNVYGLEGTTEAIKKGTAYMSVWMYVIGQMEVAIDDCEANCATDGCSDDQMHAWDEAVAFYTGSVPKTLSGDGGYLLYTLAQKRCENFGTCLTSLLHGATSTGMANVNWNVFYHFKNGQQDLLRGDCAAAEPRVARISQLMAVPLIQGTLRHAYVQDKQNDDREKAQAEGATYAAAVLPLVHACSMDDADIIYNNMRVGNAGSASFEVVKEAFERNYNCLGITCEDVGGLVDTVSGGYLNGAEPCGNFGTETGETETGETETVETDEGDSLAEVDITISRSEYEELLNDVASLSEVIKGLEARLLNLTNS